MSRGKGLPRFIDQSCIEEGDVIRVVWSHGGIEHARTARVHRIIGENRAYQYITEEGSEIFHWIHGEKKTRRVTLLAVTPREQNTVPMFDLDELERLAG